MEGRRNASAILLVVGSLLVVTGAAGCAGESGARGPADRTGIELGMNIRGATDVAGMRFELVPVDCAGGPAGAAEPIVVVRDLEDILLPGGIPEFEDTPLDQGAAHLFADAFLSLAPGCYDIVTTPLRSDREPSADCAPAILRGIEVVAGETTEVFLINQCRSRGAGGTDVVSALNHAPVLQAVSYERSKFGLRCEPQVVCATVLDLDRDPLAWHWAQTGSPSRALVGPHEVSTVSNDDGSVTQCVAFVPGDAGRYELTVTVHDLIHDESGSLIRIEDWLAAQGYPSPSRASLAFPFYAGLAAGASEDEACDGQDDGCEARGDCPGECDPGEVLICERPIDLVLLEDLSGSFADDLASVRALVPDLFRGIRAGDPTATFGLASFVDKPFHPFGASGDYVYRQELPLVADLPALQAAVDGLVIHRGGDLPESQIEALMLLARNSAGYGFRPGAARYVVLCTDAPYHVAGDCTACVPNNGDGNIDPNEDYPSIDQVRAALVDAHIIPVFAVTASRVRLYESLAAELGIEGAVVTTLAPDSSNLVEAVLDGIGDTCTCQPVGPVE